MIETVAGDFRHIAVLIFMIRGKCRFAVRQNMRYDKDWRLERLDEKYEIVVSKKYGFTTDTLLLAHFARPEKHEICADFGTGCGTIAFLWRIRYDPKMIYAVELQSEALRQAKTSLRHNSFERVTLIQADIRNIREILPHQSLDRIACNPPYKARNAGLKSPDRSRSVAWSEEELTMRELAENSRYALKHEGKLCICQRPERLSEILCLFSDNGLEPKRMCLVQQSTDHAPSLFLLEARKSGKPGLTVEPTLMIKDSEDFSAEMKQIYGSYYDR